MMHRQYSLARIGRIQTDPFHGVQGLICNQLGEEPVDRGNLTDQFEGLAIPTDMLPFAEEVVNTGNQFGFDLHAELKVGEGKGLSRLAVFSQLQP